MPESAPKANPIAQELTAQIQVGLYGTVGHLARQLRLIDKIAPRLKENGIIRQLNVDRLRRRRAAGFAATHTSTEAFGGLLFAVGVLKHELTTEDSTLSHAGQDSRVTVGDMTHLEADRRLAWKQYDLMYDVLQATFESENGLPDYLILGVPLLFGREIYALGFDDDVLRAEIEKLKNRAEQFWESNRPRCFPFDPKGPRVATVHPGRPSQILRELMQAKPGHAVSPDRLGSELTVLLEKNNKALLSANINRVMLGLLAPGFRTAAWSSADSMDSRAFPRSLITEGMLSFCYQAGLRGGITQVETLGGPDRWTPEAVDDLAASLMALTVFDHRSAEPLPLWYARESLAPIRKRFQGKNWLDVYKGMVKKAMRGEQVEAAWLRGWDQEGKAD